MVNTVPLLIAASRSFCGLPNSDQLRNPDVNSSGLDPGGRIDRLSVGCDEPGLDDPCLPAGEVTDEGSGVPVLPSIRATSATAEVKSGNNHLRYVLSRLSYDSTVSVASDWSGSLSLARGAAILRWVRPVDSSQDFFFPCAGRTTLERAFRTSVHNDGITLDSVVSKPKPVLGTSTITDVARGGNTTNTISIDIAYASTEPAVITFGPGPSCSTFTLEEISALDIFGCPESKV